MLTLSKRNGSRYTNFKHTMWSKRNGGGSCVYIKLKNQAKLKHKVKDSGYL